MKQDSAKTGPAVRRRISGRGMPGRILGMNTSVFIAVVLAVAAVAWILSGQFEDGGPPGQAGGAPGPGPQTAGPAAEEAPPMAVRVRTMTAQTRAQAIVIRGQTEADRTVTVRAETAGRVEAVGGRRGTKLETGAPIARIAPDDRPARLAEARALLEQRRIEHEAARNLAEKGHRSQTAVAAAQAAYESAQAAVARIELDIAHTEITAPFDGMLEERPVEVGDFVDIGDPVATVVDLDPIVITAHVSENEIGKLAVGAPGHATVTTGHELDGTVRYISASGREGTRTFRVELEAPNPDGAVVAGVTAEMRLPVDEVKAHTMSPAVLTLDDAGRVGVKIVNERDLVEFHPVTIIDDTAEGIWLAGLPQTVRVITVGQEFVKHGQRVRPQESAALAEDRR